MQAGSSALGVGAAGHGAIDPEDLRRAGNDLSNFVDQAVKDIKPEYLNSKAGPFLLMADKIKDLISSDSASGGSCGNGEDPEDETLQSRGNKIKKRTADHFGKNRREVGRALEALKRENGLRNDYHQMRIMRSGNVIDKNTNQIIDNLWNYMH